MRILGISAFFFFLAAFANAKSIDITEMKPGELKKASWEGSLVYVYKRTPEQIKSVRSQSISESTSSTLEATFTTIARSYDNRRASLIRYLTLELDDKPSRSIRDDILVVLGFSSYFGCLVTLESKNGQFIDSCSNAHYGVDGRIQRTNNREIFHLLIPPHYYEGDNLIISSETKATVEMLDFSPDIMSLKMSDGEKLIEAIQWDKKEVILQLLARKKGFSYRTRTGASALHGAAGNSDPEVIEKMVQLGFDINEQTDSGITPLQMALLAGNEPAAVTLIRLGARTDSFCNFWTCSKSAEEFLMDSFPQASPKMIKDHLKQLRDDAQ